MDNANSVLTASVTDFATIALSINVLDPLGGGASLAVHGVSGSAGTNPGFTIVYPAAMLATVAVLPDVTISTFAGGNLVDSQSYGGVLTVDVLGLLANDAPVYLGVKATAPYDAVQIKATATVANVLQDVDVYNACSNGQSATGIPTTL